MWTFFPQTLPRTTLAAGLLTALPAVTVPAGLAVLISPAPARAAAPVRTVTAPDGATFDRFGWSIATDGSTLVVGAPYRDGAKGAVYVFERSGDVWTAAATLTASDGAANDWLGWSVALDGDTVVAGAPGDDDGGAGDRGAVYTFARTGPATRTETAKLTASDGAANDWLGGSVAVDGTTIVVSADWADVAGHVDQGALYTFTTTGAASRTETAKLTTSDGAAGDWTGYSVGIEGDTIVTGAHLADAGGIDRGAVYTFASTGTAQRNETARLTATDGAAGDQLGAGVAIDGDTIVAGATGDDTGTNADQGAAYTFTRTGAAARSQTGKLTASDGGAQDRLGRSVAVSGDWIAVGAPFEQVNGFDFEGAAYSFTRAGPAARTEAAKMTLSQDGTFLNLGLSVALEGEHMLAGAPYVQVGANLAQGSVSVFRAAGDPVVPPPTTTPKDTTPPDTTGLAGPRKVTLGKIATFRFSSTEPGSTFQCRVDKKAYKPCASPYKVKTKKLRLGKHTLWVVAVDAAGNRDQSPAKTRFTVTPKRHTT